jgi:hypothetical protein
VNPRQSPLRLPAPSGALTETKSLELTEVDDTVLTLGKFDQSGLAIRLGTKRPVFRRNVPSLRHAGQDAGRAVTRGLRR